ncbi:MAG: 4-hydroxy-tetrahydrodipicolinate synthase, partial [Clostridia bacterium]|nr:4-hydroxy-tetrahydrodipicolinate synthase [Clostridia bacterium]
MTKLFEGSATALITPFLNNTIDYSSMADIIDFQIESGTDALVVCGTTGEVSTLSKEERERLIEFTIERSAGRVPVIAGTGGNNTDVAGEMSLFAKKAGADGILSVAPYYNKGTKEGIIRHYRYIAEKSELPVIVYNVPSRTGVSLTPQMYLELSHIPNIVAIKEANGNAASWL